MEVYKFKKNAYETIVIQFTEFKEKELLDLRIWYDSDEGENLLKPSPKGIAISRDLIPELKKGIDLALKELEKQLK